MKKTQRQLKKEKHLLEIDTKRRFLNRNVEAMSFCNKHGLTIYPASQSYNMLVVMLFVQKGTSFKKLDGVLYNQKESQDIIAYTAAIDREYERLYLKMKDKV
tara:strand:- start:3468 stop:3773 length:306 start_codon:yes stop_codon:yes gene_type:complete